MNPGPWVSHSVHAANAAKATAKADPDLDADRAYVLGLLHDIGRREGRTDMRHILDGYAFLKSHGYEDAARICLTHSFPLQDTNSASGTWDCTPEERAFVDEYVAGVEYDDYDRLIQLCDALALPAGCVLLEKRLVEVVMRHGTNALTVEKWHATFELKNRFEARICGSIYDRLPGVLENTFGGQHA
jgi:hypothetical protein